MPNSYIDLYFSGFISLTVLVTLIIFLWIYLRATLEAKRREFTDYRIRELEAIDKVREQISNDLHDSGASILTQFRVKLNDIERHLYEPELATKSIIELKQSLNEFSNLLIDTIEQVFPKELILGHWTQAIEECALRFQTTDLKILFHNEISLMDQMEPIRANQCFRVVQELLTNVIKYERPKLLVIEIYKDQDEVVVILDSDECDFDGVEQDSISGGRGNIHFVSRLKFLGAKIHAEKNKLNKNSCYTLRFKENGNTGS